MLEELELAAAVEQFQQYSPPAASAADDAGETVFDDLIAKLANSKINS